MLLVPEVYLTAQIRELLDEPEMLMDSELISISHDYLPFNDKPLFVFVFAEKLSHGVYTPKILVVRAQILYGASPQGKNLVKFRKTAPIMTLIGVDGKPVELSLDDFSTIKFCKGYQIAEISRISGVSKDHSFMYFGLGSHGF